MGSLLMMIQLNVL